MAGLLTSLVFGLPTLVSGLIGAVLNPVTEVVFALLNVLLGVL